VLIPKKNLDDLIQACSIVRKKVGDFKLVISGYGEISEKRRLNKIVNNLGLENHVRFTDYVSEEYLVSYYQAADVFVHLSAVEGGPGSAMQALVTNTPLVMTPVGCVGELLQISNLGSIFPVGDVSCCAEKIIEVITSADTPQTSEIAKKLYSWETRGKSMAKDIEAVWGK
jgi:glycosyltransferase involved in cell wall biosynthesis